MTIQDMRALRGFSQPLGDGGAYQLYGPPPWHPEKREEKFV